MALRLLLKLVSPLYHAYLHTRWKRFDRAARHPEQTQAQRLTQILQANQSSAFGKEFRFAEIDSISAFQQRLPIANYELFSPWIDRIANGEPNVLTRASVQMFERTSGSTTANKLIPYTQPLLAEFSNATDAWIFDLIHHFPRLKSLRSYWAISPVGKGKELTAGGIPIGFQDDSEYLLPLLRWAFAQASAVPASVSQMSDITEWRLTTARHLLAAEDLGLISVWSPTFLTELMRVISDNWSELLAELPASRRKQLESARNHSGTINGQTLWPQLHLISCWEDGASTQFLPMLKAFFPTLPIQGKGLLATEGVVSFPLCRHAGSVLAITSHFLEFLDLDHPNQKPILAHELRPGGQYSPLLTTGGGLYRYHLKDRVTCVGAFAQTPLVRFEGKLDQTSDLCGEKLSAGMVEHILAKVQTEFSLTVHFALLAPVQTDPPHYGLFLESNANLEQLKALESHLENWLRDNAHYAYCRRLNQLGKVCIYPISNGWKHYQARLIAEGTRLGDIKPTNLDRRWGWKETFPQF